MTTIEPLLSSPLLAAASQASSDMQLSELLAHGGWAMYPIYACSILTVGMFFKKLFDVRAAKLAEIRWLEQILHDVESGDLGEARQGFRGVMHPGARVVGAVLAALEEAPEQAEAEAKRVATLELQRLERGVGTLSFLAQVSPLLGLLGTVLGMVDLFMGLQGAEQGDLAISDLASGIWKALLTTAAGLTVAVPALAGYTFLTSRFDELKVQLADMVQRVLFSASKRSAS